MLKVLGRLLILLLAATLVAGVTYAVVQNVQFSLPGGRGGDDFGGQIVPGGGNANGSSAPDPVERPRGGRGQMLSDGEFRGGELEGGSVFGWAEVIKSLGVIAFVTAGVVLVQKTYARLCKPKKPAAGAQPGS